MDLEVASRGAGPPQKVIGEICKDTSDNTRAEHFRVTHLSSQGVTRADVTPTSVTTNGFISNGTPIVCVAAASTTTVHSPVSIHPSSCPASAPSCSHCKSEHRKQRKSSKVNLDNFLYHPQFRILCFIYLFSLLPGFAVKFTISPLVSAVYTATEAQQIGISVIFLISYAFSRLAIGFTGKSIDTKKALVIATALQSAALVCVGLTVLLGNRQSNAMLWIFTALISAVGCGLAVTKVLLKVLILKCWGRKLFAPVQTYVLVFFGLAAMLGAIISWGSLSLPGFVPVDNALDSVLSEAQIKVMTKSVGFMFLLLSVMAFLASYSVSKFFQKVDF